MLKIFQNQRKIYPIVFLFILISLVLILTPSEPLYAQSDECPGGEEVPDDCESCSEEDKGGLVPCGRYCDDPTTEPLVECCPCTLCHVFLLINRLILFLRNAAFLVATILIVTGGAMMLLSGAYQGLRSKGKNIVTSAVTGLVIVLLAWVITASVLVVLVGRSNAETFFNLKTASFKIQCTAD